MAKPFEVDARYLAAHLDELVSSVFSDLQSQFLVLPKGPSFVEYQEFQIAYEDLKSKTAAFSDLTAERVWSSLQENALSFLVLRTILGTSPPEWADLAKSDLGADIPQNAVRDIDSKCRADSSFFRTLSVNGVTFQRVKALVSVAITYITRGAPSASEDTVHRLRKVDTRSGLGSLRHAATHHVPYAVLLYERYLGRPFASHRDSVSELVGDVMESAIEERLSRAMITYRKTKRAERVPGFEQAPDFFVPDEFSPAVIIEAKITGDDGTARDKVTRIEKLATIRDHKIQQGERPFEVIACIDGRGFGVRREDMKRMLLRTEGKVFTLSTLDALINHTRLREFLPRR